MSVKEEGTVTLNATTNNAGSATISWISNNTNIATISPSTGSSTTVTGVTEGSTTVTASITVDNVEYSATCTVTVSNELTINDGEATSAYIPLYGYNSDSQNTSQMLYPASSLTEINGKIISKLVFYFTSHSGNYSLADSWRVKMGTTEATTLDELDVTTTLSQVYLGALDINTTDMTMTILFDEEYLYTGDNLLIQLYNETKGYHTYTFAGITTTENASYNSYSTVHAQKFLPKTTFKYEDATGCTNPTNLQVPNDYLTYSSAKLTWGGLASAFDVALSTTDKDEPAAAEIVATAQTDKEYTFSLPTQNTTYYAFVRGNCGSGSTSDWVKKSFTTVACPVPTSLEYDNLAATSVNLTWSGDADSYNIQYRKAAGVTDTKLLFQGFEGDGTLASGWTATDNGNVLDNASELGVSAEAKNNGDYGFKFCSYNGESSNSFDQYLISPDLTSTGIGQLEFAYKRSDNAYESFRVGYSSTTNDLSAFTWGAVQTVSSSTWQTYSEEMPEGTKFFAINYTSQWKYRLYIDDITIYQIQTAGAWQSTTSEETSKQLTGLDVTTKYEAQVQGVYGNQTSAWCNAINFTTTPFTKHITGYTSLGSGDEVNEVGWYLIASPVVEDITPSSDNGFLANEYDLYRFNQSAEDEWENWKQEGDHYQFNIESGKGYLYANSEDVTLQFTGTPYTGNGEIALDYLNDNPSDEYMYGWNLVGNPFGTAATVDRDYYRLGQESRNLIPGTATEDIVEAMEGIFVKAEGEGENVTFTPATQNANANNNALVVMNLSQNRGNLIDRAIVRFNESRQLPKFMLNPANTKIYIPQDGKEYAIATAEAQGEMPVNFKARENGTYTLTVNPENVEMSYLHLIDNMTGDDIDLLQTPSYTFNATTRDYESRFRLVFSANGENGASTGSATFAFFSNGSLIVNNEGEATLQVVDLMGRVLSSETINGCHSMSLNVAPGVYMIRLINGNNVKVQKIVVR